MSSSSSLPKPSRSRIPSLSAATRVPESVNSSPAASPSLTTSLTPRVSRQRLDSSPSSPTFSSAAKTITKSKSSSQLRQPTTSRSRTVSTSVPAPQSPPARSPLRSTAPRPPVQKAKSTTTKTESTSTRPTSSPAQSLPSMSHETLPRSLARKSSNLAANAITSRPSPSTSRSTLADPPSKQEPATRSTVSSSSRPTPTNPSVTNAPQTMTMSRSKIPPTTPSATLKRPASSSNIGNTNRLPRKPPPSIDSPTSPSRPNPTPSSSSKLPRSASVTVGPSRAQREIPKPISLTVAPTNKERVAPAPAPLTSAPLRQRAESSPALDRRNQNGRSGEQEHSRSRDQSRSNSPSRTRQDILPTAPSTFTPTKSSNRPNPSAKQIVTPPTIVAVPAPRRSSLIPARDPDVAMLSTALNTAFASQPIVPTLGHDIAEDMKARSIRSNNSSPSPAPSLQEDKKDKKRVKNVLKRRPSQKDGFLSGLLKTPTGGNFKGKEITAPKAPPTLSLTAPDSQAPVTSLSRNNSASRNAPALSAVGLHNPPLPDLEPPSTVAATKTPIYETFRRPTDYPFGFPSNVPPIPPEPARDRKNSSASALSNASSDFPTLKYHLNESTTSTTSEPPPNSPTRKSSEKRRGRFDFKDLDKGGQGGVGFEVIQKLADQEKPDELHADPKPPGRSSTSPHTRELSHESLRTRLRALSNPDPPVKFEIVNPPSVPSELPQPPLFHLHKPSSSIDQKPAKGHQSRESKDAMPYYTVLGATTGRVVAVGSPQDSQLSDYTATGYVWDHTKGEYVKQPSKLEGAPKIGRTLSRKMSEKWKRTGGGVKSEDGHESRGRSSLSRDREPGKGNRDSLRISVERDRRHESPYPAPSSGGLSSSPSTSMHTSAMPTPATSWSNIPATAASTSAPSLGPRYNEPRSRKSEPAGLHKDGGSKIWKLMKRISTGGLREKYAHDEGAAPPVPALPKDLQQAAGFPLYSQSQDGHGGRRQIRTVDTNDDPSNVKSKFLSSRPSMSTERPRPLPARPLPIAGTSSSSTASSVTQGRPSTNTLSSSVSSDRDRFGFMHKTSSTSSVSSSWGGTAEGDDERPPVPKVPYVPQHIMAPSELQKMMASNDPKPRKSTERAKLKAQEVLGMGATPLKGEDWEWTMTRSPVEEKPSLPLPPTRRHSAAPSQTGAYSSFQDKPPSPTIPSFSTDGAINTFSSSRNSSRKNSPTTLTSSSKLPNSSSRSAQPTPQTPPPRPSRSTSRPAPGSGSSSRVTSPTPPAVVPEDKPGRSRVRTLPPKPSQRSVSNGPSSVSFRELPKQPDRYPLTEDEKNEKWNDLLARTMGGTLQLGSGDPLESERSGWIDD